MRLGKRSLLLLMILGAALPTLASTQVHVNVNIGPPAPVIVEAPPQMLFLPDPGVYVAVGIPYDVYFIEGRYYYYHGDHWFWGPGYRGPWTFVEYRTLPPGLRRYKVVRLREYRDHEYRVYKVKGNDFHGKYFVAVDDDDRGNGRGRGHGKGKKHYAAAEVYDLGFIQQ
jgi:hypothetical protein